MSLHITQKDSDWLLLIKERWVFKDEESCVKVMRYMMNRDIPFKVEYGIGRFIVFDAAEFQISDFSKFIEVVDEMLKLKKAYGDVHNLVG